MVTAVDSKNATHSRRLTAEPGSPERITQNHFAVVADLSFLIGEGPP
jgi:hypothetical protein